MQQAADSGQRRELFLVPVEQQAAVLDVDRVRSLEAGECRRADRLLAIAFRSKLDDAEGEDAVAIAAAMILSDADQPGRPLPDRPGHARPADRAADRARWMLLEPAEQRVRGP